MARKAGRQQNNTAVNKYIKENQRLFRVKVNRRTEPELLDWLQGKENVQGYVKQLIIQDMQLESLGAKQKAENYIKKLIREEIRKKGGEADG